MVALASDWTKFWNNNVFIHDTEDNYKVIAIELWKRIEFSI